MSLFIVPERIEEVLNGDLYSLPAAFHWSKSKEGFEYWSDIEKRKKPLDSEAKKKLIKYLFSSPRNDVLKPKGL